MTPVRFWRFSTWVRILMIVGLGLLAFAPIPAWLFFVYVASAVYLNETALAGMDQP